MATFFAGHVILNTAAEARRLIVVGMDGREVVERPDQWSSTGKRASEMALPERLAFGDRLIEAEHLALAVTNDACDESAGIIRQVGVPLPTARVELARRLGHSAAPPAPPWPVSSADKPVRPDLASGCSTPEEVASR